MEASSSHPVVISVLCKTVNFTREKKTLPFHLDILYASSIEHWWLLFECCCHANNLHKITNDLMIYIIQWKTAKLILFHHSGGRCSKCYLCLPHQTVNGFQTHDNDHVFGSLFKAFNPLCVFHLIFTSISHGIGKALSLSWLLNSINARTNQWNAETFEQHLFVFNVVRFHFQHKFDNHFEFEWHLFAIVAKLLSLP